MPTGYSSIYCQQYYKYQNQTLFLHHIMYEVWTKSQNEHHRWTYNLDLDRKRCTLDIVELYTNRDEENTVESNTLEYTLTFKGQPRIDRTNRIEYFLTEDQIIHWF